MITVKDCQFLKTDRGIMPLVFSRDFHENNGDRWDIPFEEFTDKMFYQDDEIMEILENIIKRPHGYFIRDDAKQTQLTPQQMRNFFKKGIKNAKTLDYLKENSKYLYRLYYRLTAVTKTYEIKVVYEGYISEESEIGRVIERIKIIRDLNSIDAVKYILNFGYDSKYKMEWFKHKINDNLKDDDLVVAKYRNRYITDVTGLGIEYTQYMRDAKVLPLKEMIDLLGEKRKSWRIQIVKYDKNVENEFFLLSKIGYFAGIRKYGFAYHSSKARAQSFRTKKDAENYLEKYKNRLDIEKYQWRIVQ